MFSESKKGKGTFYIKGILRVKKENLTIPSGENGLKIWLANVHG